MSFSTNIEFFSLLVSILLWERICSSPPVKPIKQYGRLSWDSCWAACQHSSSSNSSSYSPRFVFFFFICLYSKQLKWVAAAAAADWIGSDQWVENVYTSSSLRPKTAKKCVLDQNQLRSWRTDRVDKKSCWVWRRDWKLVKWAAKYIFRERDPNTLYYLEGKKRVVKWAAGSNRLAD